MRTLMANYPVGGLEPVAKLAAAAGVSPPTVVRLTVKLGFDSYAEFQRSLKSEMSLRLSSPLQMHAERPGTARERVLLHSERLLCEGIQSSFARLPPGEFEHAVSLLADTRRSVTLIGGRFSNMLAEYLAAHLKILRSRVQVLSAAGPDRVSAMLDVGRRDVFVAFDYRRYQHDTIYLALTAKERGAKLVAFTDPYLSPLAARADVILTSSVQSPSPFDALTPAMALVEALIAALVDRFEDEPRARMARYDALNVGLVVGASGPPRGEGKARDDG